MTGVLALYKEWLAKATPEQVAFVDSVFELAVKNYERGGDVVVETFEPDEILEEFSNLEEVKEYIGLKVEQALNQRWGEDTDPQLVTYRAFQNEWEQ